MKNLKIKLLYIALGFIAWVVTEYVTVWAERGLGEWASYMPFILLFYIAWPWLYAYLIYDRNWDKGKLIVSSVVIGFLLELTFFQNYALVQLPTAFYYVPALILIYSFLTLAPKYAVKKIAPKL